MTRRSAFLPALLLLAGCAVPGAVPPAPPPKAAVAQPASAAALPADPAARLADAEDKLSRLQALRADEAAEFEKRLAVVERERDLAVTEVVRMRARMQGMVSQAAAGAMYAEARVLIDRMAEDAYSTGARDALATARKRIEEGKVELDRGNPGGAAFLLDQVSNVYEGFRKMSPRHLVVSTPVAVLRAAAGAGAKAVAEARAGDRLEGVDRQEGWVQVRDGSGKKGWVPWEAVR